MGFELRNHRLTVDRATLLEAARVCGCFNLRRASRAVTRLYDQVLEPGGLRSTGFVALVLVQAEGEVTLPTLASRLGVDRSTLTRNLAPLRRQGLIEVLHRGVARTGTSRVTPKGRAALQRCIPLWKKAQAQFEARVGSQRWAELLVGLDAIVRAAPEDGGR